MVEANIPEELLGAVFDLHEGNIGMLVTVVDGEENKFLNPHGFCTLDKSNFAFPINLK